MSTHPQYPDVEGFKAYDPWPIRLGIFLPLRRQISCFFSTESMQSARIMVVGWQMSIHITKFAEAISSVSSDILTKHRAKNSSYKLSRRKWYHWIQYQFPVTFLGAVLPQPEHAPNAQPSAANQMGQRFSGNLVPSHSMKKRRYASPASVSTCWTNVGIICNYPTAQLLQCIIRGNIIAHPAAFGAGWSMKQWRTMQICIRFSAGLLIKEEHVVLPWIWYLDMFYWLLMGSVGHTYARLSSVKFVYPWGIERWPVWYVIAGNEDVLLAGQGNSTLQLCAPCRNSEDCEEGKWYISAKVWVMLLSSRCQT